MNDKWGKNGNGGRAAGPKVRTQLFECCRFLGAEGSGCRLCGVSVALQLKASAN
jgi:hypothetical protein